LSVKPGSDYVVCEVLQSGWHNSDPGSDTNPCKDVGTPSSGGTKTAKLGNYQNVTINVTKYLDANANGSPDSGENGLAGWTIFLDANGNHQLDTGEAVHVADGTGLASFSVKPGSAYTVCEVLQGGYHNSDPGSDTNPCKSAGTPSSNDKVGRVLGNYQNATINVTKYLDNNADGVKNGADTGLSGGVIFLDANGNHQLDSGEFSQATDGAGLTSSSEKHESA